MSNWELKSEMTFRASNRLITDLLFNASVHASYYSCVQMMLHISSLHFGFDDKALDNLHQETKNSVHQHLKKTIYQSLRTHNPDFAVDFNDDISRLSIRRNTADYKSEIIGEKEAEELRQLAYTTLANLKTTYNNI
jgi:hypothetical protein